MCQWYWCSPTRYTTSVLLLASYMLSGGQKRTLRTSKSVLHAWWWSRQILQTDTSFPRSSRGQNGLSKLLQAFYALGDGQNRVSELQKTLLCAWGGHNGLSKLLQATYTLGGSQNGLSELLQATYFFLVASLSGRIPLSCGCYKFRMRLALNALSSARKLTQNIWSLKSSTQLIPSMTCAKRSGSRAGSGSSSSRSCSCGGVCLSSSLCFVSSNGHVEMKWGASSSCDAEFTRQVIASLPVTP